MKKSKVYLVGAGPGDPGLITVRGAEVLAQADCVVYDRLANESLLGLARKEAQLISVGKRSGEHSYKQDEINDLLVNLAKQGKTIVRLKGGDPCIFGRGAEEAGRLVRECIEFEFVPGVTAALGASEYAGIMLTHRDHSSAVAFVTGHESDTKNRSSIDFAVLAKFDGTLVFYMGMSTLENIVSGLIDNGMDPEMPVAIVADATLSTQRIVMGPLREIGRITVDADIRPPAVIIIGKGAKSDEQLQWFTSKPLFGRTVILTRDAAGNVEFARRIAQQGGNVMQYPSIELVSLVRQSSFETQISHLSEFEWVFFTSANGVEFVFEHLSSLGKDARVFGANKIAAIGVRTADKLRQYGINADFVPAHFTTAALGSEFKSTFQIAGKKVLLLRSAIANNDLDEGLVASGAQLVRIDVYTAKPVAFDPKRLIDQVCRQRDIWISFTSASTVDAFFSSIGGDAIKNRVKILSIGPVTSEQVRRHGLDVDLEAKEHTTASMVETLCEYLKESTDA